MIIDDIRTVLILGAGTMGQQISIPCTLNGYDVVLYDISDEVLAKSKRHIEKMMPPVAMGKSLTQDDVQKALARITYTTDTRVAGEKADIIIECVPEDPQLKGRIFAEFNAICKPHTIFTTNTSSLKPSSFAAATGRPEKLLAFHFHDVRVTTIVDVMPHPGTSAETVELVAEFARRIGQVPIMLQKESTGYVFNAMLMSLFASALTLAANEVAEVEDIDRAWMGVTRMFIGPFGLMDSIGLGTVWKLTDYWAKQSNNKQGMKNAEFIKKYLDQGFTGQQVRQGFYKYPSPSFAQPDFVASIDKKGK